MSKQDDGQEVLAWIVGLVTAGLVVAMLLPYFSHSHRKIRSANCLSNVKQIGLAIAMYADNFHERCPMDSGNPTLFGSMLLITNTAGSPKIFHCPYDDRRGAVSAVNFTVMTLSNLSYSYVPGFVWGDVTPDSAIALDRIYTTKKGDRWPWNGNHGTTGGNILYLDGHCNFQPSLPCDLKDKYGRRIVLSP